MHRHSSAYAALVLEGGYHEFGVDGRWLCEAGDIVLHPELDLHGDVFTQRGSRVLNIALPHSTVESFCVYRLHDSDLALKAATRGELLEALPDLLHAGSVAAPLQERAAVKAAREMLSQSGHLSFTSISEMIGFSREHATRAFSQWYGMSPGSFRRERRLRRALRRIDDGTRLVDVAAEAGYADQGHMTRSMRAALGVTPGSRQRKGRHTRSKP